MHRFISYLNTLYNLECQTPVPGPGTRRKAYVQGGDRGSPNCYDGHANCRAFGDSLTRYNTTCIRTVWYEATIRNRCGRYSDNRLHSQHSYGISVSTAREESLQHGTHSKKERGKSPCPITIVSYGNMWMWEYTRRGMIPSHWAESLGDGLPCESYHIGDPESAVEGWRHSSSHSAVCKKTVSSIVCWLLFFCLEQTWNPLFGEKFLFCLIVQCYGSIIILHTCILVTFHYLYIFKKMVYK